MNIKDFKHCPVFWDDHDRANCVIGNVSIYTVKIKNKEQYSLDIYGDNRWGVSQFGKIYKTKDEAKKEVQRLCDDYLQQAIGWLDNNVKYKLDGI